MGKALGFAAAAAAVLVVLGAVAPGALAEAEVVTRADFPAGFVFGVGSSAYQVEGAVAEDGRKPSIWDTFTHDGYSNDNATGDVAADQYHKYKDDVKLLHEMGVDAYRMSIAWPRLIPGMALHTISIKPPNNYIFRKNTASLTFMGDEVTLAFGLYALMQRGLHDQKDHDSRMMHFYRHGMIFCFVDQAEQEGQIGLTLLGLWYEPATETLDDIEASARMNDFHLGWFMHPMVYGDYPPVMRKNVGSRLPSFTDEERKRKLLKHLRVKYKNPVVMIHENGVAGQSDPCGANTYNDEFRSKFLQDYIEATLHSIRNGSNVQGYFVWAFLDVFEYLFGYRLQFGVYGVDFNSTARTRYQRHSAKWYSSFLRGGELRPVTLPDRAYSQ
nr:unnamed protein product [Digitaria exilis]